MKPTTEILERIRKSSANHKDGVFTRLYRYLLRDDVYKIAYKNLYANQGAATKGTDNDTADSFSQEYIDKIFMELSSGTYEPKPVRRTHRENVIRRHFPTLPIHHRYGKCEGYGKGYRNAE